MEEKEKTYVENEIGRGHGGKVEGFGLTPSLDLRIKSLKGKCVDPFYCKCFDPFYCKCFDPFFCNCFNPFYCKCSDPFYCKLSNLSYCKCPDLFLLQFYLYICFEYEEL